MLKMAGYLSILWVSVNLHCVYLLHVYLSNKICLAFVFVVMNHLKKSISDLMCSRLKN